MLPDRGRFPPAHNLHIAGLCVGGGGGEKKIIQRGEKRKGMEREGEGGRREEGRGRSKKEKGRSC